MEKRRKMRKRSKEGREGGNEGGKGKGIEGRKGGRERSRKRRRKKRKGRKEYEKGKASHERNILLRDILFLFQYPKFNNYSWLAMQADISVSANKKQQQLPNEMDL